MLGINSLNGVIFVKHVTVVCLNIFCILLFSLILCQSLHTSGSYCLKDYCVYQGTEVAITLFQFNNTFCDLGSRMQCLSFCVESLNFTEVQVLPSVQSVCIQSFRFC